MYKQWSFKLLSTIGILIHLLLVDIPKDIIRWITLNQKNVDGQLIVVTGGASGLGRRITEILSLEGGARAVILDVNLCEARETVASIVHGGGQAYAYYCDISNDEEVRKVAQDIFQEHGKVDIVVCNAAVLIFALFKDLSVNQLRRSIAVNILGTINTIRGFIEPMEKRNSGHIVAVSSIAGFSGETFGLAYCPTKFAVRGIMECLEMELRDRGLDGVICTTLCPYFSRTPMVLRVGLRPKCTWFPFMSIESCSRRMIDAILKEKGISFMPNYISLVAMMKGLLSMNTGRSLREYVGINYTPDHQSLSARRRPSTASEEYFFSPHAVWWMPSFALFSTLLYWPSALQNYLLPFLTSTPSIRKQSDCLVSIILFVFSVNFTQGVYTLLLCDELRLSFACAAKWFMQTVCVGYPSLRILMEHVHRARKH